MSLAAHDGSSRFAAALLRVMRTQQERRRPELGYATIVNGRVQPDDWTGMPFELHTSEHREPPEDAEERRRRTEEDATHWELQDGDRVVVGWVAGYPWVVGRLSSARDRWWPTDQKQHDDLVARVAALEAAFAAHVAAPHP